MFHRAFADIIIIYRVFYKGNGDLKKARILGFGVNQMGDSAGKNPGIHAECDALTKLMPLKNKKRLENNYLIFQYLCKILFKYLLSVKI